jgi:tetratricopeptide (TPR) repeat protein
MDSLVAMDRNNIIIDEVGSRSSLCLVSILVLGACSARHERDLPDLPRLTIANFRPQIRDQVQKAYDDVKARPKDAESNGRLGMLLQAFSQFESAELCYRRARILDPNRFQWAYYLGLTQSLDGKNEEASRNLRDATRLDPQYLPARLKLAEVLLALGRLDDSQTICHSIVKDNPQVAPAYYWLGRVDSAKGDVQAAIEQYGKACQLWPSYGTAHYALALAYQGTGAKAEAQQHMAAYQKYKADGDPQPEDPQLEAVRSLDNTALAHLMKGVDLENAGQVDGAITEHEEAVKQDPKLAQAHANLIALYARAGRADKAEAEYRATIGINPNLPQSHYDYGVFLVSQRRYREAEDAFRKALESSPNYAEAHSNLGAMLELRGKSEEAIQQYRAAIDGKPNYRMAHFQLGRLLLMKSRAAEAIAQLSQTLGPEDGDTPRCMYSLGLAYAESGDFASAERYLRAAGQRATSLGQSQLLGQIETALRKVAERTGR